MGGQSNDRGYNGRMGMGGMPRGGPRGYGQQPLPPHDGYDHSAVGDRQGPMSARLVNNNLNVAASNLPSNSGRFYPFCCIPFFQSTKNHSHYICCIILYVLTRLTQISLSCHGSYEYHCVFCISECEYI